MQTVQNYTTHTDTKKRITLRGSKYTYYTVKEYANGCILLEPQELVPAVEISARTLKDMDAAIANFKLGTVSEAIDLSDFDKN